MDLHYLSSDLADSGLPSLISRAWATSEMAIWAERGWRNRDSGDYFGSRLSTPFRGHFGCLPAPLWLTELRFGPKIKMSEAPPQKTKKLLILILVLAARLLAGLLIRIYKTGVLARTVLFFDNSFSRRP